MRGMRLVARQLHHIVEIEIFSDVVCPWCWIGERRLVDAISASGAEVTLRWRAFQLDPTATSTGTPLVQWLGRRYGGEHNARRMFTNVTSVASQAGLTMNFDKAISANTFDAHRLIWMAGRDGADQRPMVEALHKAHFTDGLDLGSRPALASIAASVDPSFSGVLDELSSDAGVAEVQAELSAARDLGITSVPTFIFDKQYAVSGAQDSHTFQQVLASLDVCSVDVPC
nr:DsbA family oxidoreductase [Catelliglobosispora koreensis]